MGIHFFTGFPGFITSKLIHQLFEKNITDEVFVLVLQTELEKAEIEASKLVSRFPGRHIEMVVGDITLPHLGLGQAFLKKYSTRISVFWHLAAIYDLAVPREIAWAVNVNGTRQVINFVKQLPLLHRFMYFSTAYVAGNREGVIRETELIRPAHFKNHYEETKFEAEVLVEQVKVDVPTTIIRPGIVKGDSKTGNTTKFDGPYFFLNMIDKLKFCPFIPYIGSPKTKINVVPIDYIMDAATYICIEPTAEGKTLHLTDPFPHPVKEVYRMMVKEMTGKLPKGSLPLTFAKKSLQIKSIRKLLGVELETLDYLDWNAEFDCTQAKEILRKGNVKCPDFLTSIPAMVRFYEHHKKIKQYHIQIK